MAEGRWAGAAMESAPVFFRGSMVPGWTRGRGRLLYRQAGLEMGGWRWQYSSTMSVAELKESVRSLPAEERHEFVAWVNRLEGDYGDVPGEALDQLAAEIWDQDDRHAPPTHPAR